MAEVIILSRDAFNITLNNESNLFTVNITADVEYDEEGFQEFLAYFNKTCFIYSLSCTLLVVGNCVCKLVVPAVILFTNSVYLVSNLFNAMF